MCVVASRDEVLVFHDGGGRFKAAATQTSSTAMVIAICIQSYCPTIACRNIIATLTTE